MFFPYRARVSLHRFPLLTVLVCLLCIGIYAAQFNNQRALYQAAGDFCDRDVLFKRFAVPAWLLAAWYIGWDVYAEMTGTGNPGVNLVVHLSGAAIGFLLGLTFFRQKRHWAQELVEE